MLKNNKSFRVTSICTLLYYGLIVLSAVRDLFPKCVPNVAYRNFLEDPNKYEIKV